MNELSSIGYSKPQFGGANKNMMYIVIALVVLALVGFFIYKYYFKTPSLIVSKSFQTFPLTIYTVPSGGSVNYSPPFQQVSTTRSSSTQALSTSTPITTINIHVNFGFNVSTPLTLSNYPAITPAILQQGIFVQIDILPASAVNSFYLTNNFTQSYFNTNTSSTFSPTLYISLIDTHNIVYAAGAATFSMFTGQQIPTAINYTVTLNGSTTLTQTNPLSGTGPFPAILVQQQQQ